MKRYPVFYLVHKALRQMLYQLATALQQTDFSHAEEANTLLEQLRAVLLLFETHASTEDRFVFAALGKFEPAVVAQFQKEHLQNHALCNRMRALLNMFDIAITSEEKQEMASAIRVAFTEFMVFQLQFMAQSSSLLNKLLWQHYTDEQLRQTTRQIIAWLPAVTTAAFNTWIMRALSNNEISHWLQEIKTLASEPVFETMLQVAARELPHNRWMAIQETITEGALLA
jgi:Hemerythrin HHE cation binding domain